MLKKEYDIIVVGGGHAGVEASYASAKFGLRILLLTLNKKMIANMPCNPHIGGSAKGVVVREIDALGGLMGIAADNHPLQMKMLNTGKGPGVQCLRSQQDKIGYPAFVHGELDKIPNLYCVGRNGQHRYNNMDHSILTGLLAADYIKENRTEKDALWEVNTEQEYHETKEEKKEN